MGFILLGGVVVVLIGILMIANRRGRFQDDDMGQISQQWIASHRAYSEDPYR